MMSDAATERPMFLEPLPENTTTSYGASVTFFCRVRSYTVPHIQVGILSTILCQLWCDVAQFAIFLNSFSKLAANGFYFVYDCLVLSCFLISLY